MDITQFIVKENDERTQLDSILIIKSVELLYPWSNEVAEMAEGGEVHVGPYGVGIGQPHQARGHPKIHIHLRLGGGG
jgi:hypothetical protein